MNPQRGGHIAGQGLADRVGARQRWGWRPMQGRALGGEWEFKGRVEARAGDRAAAQAEFRLEVVDPIPTNGMSRTQLGWKGRLKALSAAKGASLTWRFVPGARSRDRWQKFGIAPVVWQFSPPINLPFLKYGDPPYRATCLMIAVERDVVIHAPPKEGFSVFQVRQPPLDDRDKSNLGMKATRAGNPWVFVVLYPQVRIIRVQHPSLMPTFERPDSLVNSMGAPYILESFSNEAKPVEDGSLDGGSNVSDETMSKLGLMRYGGRVPGLLVLPQYDGVTIRSLLRDFTIAITVKDSNKPAGFAQAALQAGSVTQVWIHANQNIDVSIDAADFTAAGKRIYVYLHRSNLPYVPFQGDKIDRTLKYERVKIEESIVPGEIQFIFELLISFVPVVGTLYDLAQLTYMIATGRNVWGDRATAFDIVLGGTLCALTAAVPAIGKIKSSRRAGAMTEILERLEKVTDLVPDAQHPSPIIEALETLPAAPKAQFTKRVEHAIAQEGPAALKGVEEAVKEALTHLDEPARLALVDGLVRELFTEDFTTFRHVLLRYQYDFQRISRGGKREALDWLLHSKAKWVDPYMTRYLAGHLAPGETWQKAVKEVFGLEGSRVIALNQKMLEQYDKIVGQGLVNYLEAYNLVKKVPGMGRHFELDHLIEQRFVRHFIQWTDDLKEEVNFLTYLVPKNAAVAADMVALDPSSRFIQYFHNAKTDIMRELIPHGAEHLFSNQHIIDATQYALKTLGADYAIPVVKGLETDAALLTLGRAADADVAHDILARHGDVVRAAQDLGMPNLRPWNQVSDKLVSPAAGFPQVVRINGEWQLANTALARYKR